MTGGNIVVNLGCKFLHFWGGDGKDYYFNPLQISLTYMIIWCIIQILIIYAMKGRREGRGIY